MEIYVGEFISALLQFVLQIDLQLYLVWDLVTKTQGKGAEVLPEFGESGWDSGMHPSFPVTQVSSLTF